MLTFKMSRFLWPCSGISSSCNILGVKQNQSGPVSPNLWEAFSLSQMSVSLLFIGSCFYSDVFLGARSIDITRDREAWLCVLCVPAIRCFMATGPRNHCVSWLEDPRPGLRGDVNRNQKLVSWPSHCGLWVSGTSSSRELVENARARAPSEPRDQNLRPWGWVLAICVLIRPPGKSDAYWSLRPLP